MINALTCNLRTEHADDGENSWQHRREICSQVIGKQDADIIGFQEMTARQLADLRRALPQYSAVTALDGPGYGDPVNTVFYRAERFRLASSGAYWLSETPHVAGSSSWESACVRMAVWALLEDRLEGTAIRFLNTHLDHRSQSARESQARLLNEDAAAYASDLPQILTGDMNANGGNTAIASFMEAGWTDTYATVHGDLDPGNTFHAFRGPDFETVVGKIDWILVRGAVTVREAAIITDSRDGQYPSDHYFLSARLEY